MELRPSKIRYAQAKINTVFDRSCRHPRRPIGQTLDDLCEGRCNISDIPRISVCKHDGKWYTKDNRRLWVFKQLERLGKCTTIPVDEVPRSSVDDRKFSTSNGGRSVKYYTRWSDTPGGTWYLKTPVADIENSSSEEASYEEDVTVEAKTNVVSESQITPKNETIVESSGNTNEQDIGTNSHVEVEITSKTSDLNTENSKSSVVSLGVEEDCEVETGTSVVAMNETTAAPSWDTKEKNLETNSCVATESTFSMPNVTAENSANFVERSNLKEYHDVGTGPGVVAANKTPFEKESMKEPLENKKEQNVETSLEVSVEGTSDATNVDIYSTSELTITTNEDKSRTRIIVSSAMQRYVVSENPNHANENEKPRTNSSDGTEETTENAEFQDQLAIPGEVISDRTIKEDILCLSPLMTKNIFRPAQASNDLAPVEGIVESSKESGTTTLSERKDESVNVSGSSMLDNKKTVVKDAPFSWCVNDNDGNSGSTVLLLSSNSDDEEGCIGQVQCGTLSSTKEQSQTEEKSVLVWGTSEGTLVKPVNVINNEETKEYENPIGIRIRNPKSNEIKTVYKEQNSNLSDDREQLTSPNLFSQGELKREVTDSAASKLGDTSSTSQYTDLPFKTASNGPTAATPCLTSESPPPFINLSEHGECTKGPLMSSAKNFVKLDDEGATCRQNDAEQDARDRIKDTIPVNYPANGHLNHGIILSVKGYSMTDELITNPTVDSCHRNRNRSETSSQETEEVSVSNPKEKVECMKLNLNKCSKAKRERVEDDLPSPKQAKLEEFR